jgi:acetolactate synthase-1/2/3 large subunit
LREEAASDVVPISPLRLCAELADVLGDGAFVAADGGDILSFARQAVPVSEPGGWLDSGAFGCLGFGIASASAAKLARPDRAAVALLGDGALGLQAMELDTAARHGLGILVVVSTNGAWAIEASSQRMEFGRAVATKLEIRPYHRLAESLGCDGVEVSRPSELAAALRAGRPGKPLLVSVLTDPSAQSPDARRGLGLVPREQAIAYES